MIVSHRHKFIFVKTRKTAGTSVEIALSEFCGPEDIITPISERDERVRADLGFRGPQNHQVPFGHLRKSELVRSLRRWERPTFYNHMPATDIRRYLGGSVWDEYYTFTIERNPFDKAISLYYYVTTGEDPRPSMNDFVTAIPVRVLSNWGIYTREEAVLVDKVVPYESLTDGLAEVADQIGLPRLSLPRAKGGLRKDRSHYSEFLSTEARRRIEVVCAREIAQLGYEWELRSITTSSTP